MNNIFIDDRYQITCLIDWGFSSTVPLLVLLTALGLPQARDKLEDSLVSIFDDGLRVAAFNAPHDENLQEYQDLCQALQYSRPIWSLSRLLEFSSIEDLNLFSELWESIGPKDKELSDEFRARPATSYYRQLYGEITEEDPSIERVSRYKDQFFKHRSQLCLSISKKLTLISDWRSRYDQHLSQIRRNGHVFVADKRLWKWIDLWMKDFHGDMVYSTSQSIK